VRLQQSFEVDAPLESVWEALVDIERVAPCLPGAAVSGRNDDGSYNGSFSVKIGPTSASYTGKLAMTELDQAAHRASMHAQGSDRRGQGGAEATIVSTLQELPGGRTRVEVDTDYRITGRLARFGRGGMIEDIANKLLRQFADSLQALLAAGGDGGAVVDAVQPPDSAPPASEPAAPPASEPAAPPASEPAASPSPPPPVAAPPLDAGSLLGSVLLERLKRNARPLAGGALAAVGALALARLRRALRRRRRRARQGTGA
jgi:carbon monoxide dehydrogenase subunit G